MNTELAISCSSDLVSPKPGQSIYPTLLFASNTYSGTEVSDITELCPIFDPFTPSAKSITLYFGASGGISFITSYFLVSPLINVLFPLPVLPITIIASLRDFLRKFYPF